MSTLDSLGAGFLIAGFGVRALGTLAAITTASVLAITMTMPLGVGLGIGGCIFVGSIIIGALMSFVGSLMVRSSYKY